MVNRRDFLSIALASAAGAAFPARLRSGQAPRRLTVSFVGGTLFKPSGAGYLAVQPRGHKEPQHHAYLVGPAALRFRSDSPKGGPFVPLPGSYPVPRLHPALKQAARRYVVRCLDQSDVRITGAGRVAFEAKRVADYSRRMKEWRKPAGDWTTLQAPVPEILSSRFFLQGGTIRDGGLIHPFGLARWKIEGTADRGTFFNDVTDFVADNPRMTIDGTDVDLNGVDRILVLGGPIAAKSAAGELLHVKRIDRSTHPQVFRTLYTERDDETVDLVLDPWVPLRDVDKGVLPHPCFASADALAMTDCDRCSIPPDSEYCVNVLGPAS